MNQKTFKYIVGNNSIVNAAKDSDKDGVANIIDCKPNDPNKQGWIHSVGAKLAEKVGATRTAERIRERGEQVDLDREVAREDKRQTEMEVNIARREQEKKTAIYREAARGEAERKAIKERYLSTKKPTQTRGIGSFISSFSQAKPKQATGRRKVTTYIKKGKHYVKKISYRKVASAPRTNMQDRNRDGIPDILGVHSKGRRLF